MRRRGFLLAAALLTIAAALSPPLDAAAHTTLTAHMVQHLVLTMGAAPLLAASGPIGLALRRMGPAGGRVAARLLRSAPLRRLVHPVTATVLFSATLALVHLPAVYDAALRHGGLHAIEHAALFWTAVLWWMPLVGRDPVPPASGIARLAAGMVGMSAMVAVGAALSAASGVAYPSYLTAQTSTAALADQRTAGAIMGIGAMAAMLPLLLWATWAALLEEERRAVVRDAWQGRRHAAEWSAHPSAAERTPATAKGALDG